MKVQNRKSIRRLSRRALKVSRKRNVIASIAIALTTLLFTSLFTVVMSVNSSYEMYNFRQIGGYEHGSFKEVTKEQAQAIASHSKIKAVGRRKNIGYIECGVFAKVPGEVSFMDANCAEWSFAKTKVGHNPRSGNEIAMDTDSLKMLGIQPKLGTEIEITYTVGILSDRPYQKTDTFILAGWWEYDDISPVHYLNISEEYADKIEKEAVSNGQKPFNTDLNIMLKSDMDIQRQMEQVELDLGYTWDKMGDGEFVRMGVNSGYTSVKLMESIDITTVVAIITFLLLVIFTGYLIIYNIFQISVTGDIQFYGLLKTIGVTPRQLRRIIRQQALMLCRVGIPWGLVTGYAIGAVVTPKVIERTTLGSVTIINTSPLIFIVSAVFAIITVLLSCSRPGNIAAKVSPVEAAKYTEISNSKKKSRAVRGVKVYHMAFANLGRNRTKTVVVVISLALSVVLLNILINFTSGFDMEKYLERQTCADFIVSSTDYFRFNNVESYISEEQAEKIEANTNQAISGFAYTIYGEMPIGWMSEKAWRMDMRYYNSDEEIEDILDKRMKREKLIAEKTLIEGLDRSLFEKLTVVEGNITPVLKGENSAIAIVVSQDDYGNVEHPDYYPKIGTTQTITYVEEAYYIDNRIGEKATDSTPEEYLEYYIAKSHEVNYTICAYVTVPYSMSHRYSRLGYEFLITKDKLAKDSQQKVIPMVYVFDTIDEVSREAAEKYLADLTSDDFFGLMYESKAIIQAEFKSFQNIFLMLGGLLCAVIGVIGILNFFNAIMTGILSRKREFAVLQAVGMTNKQLKAMLIYEGVFYAVSAAVLALIISLIVTPLIANLLEKTFWFFSADLKIFPVLMVIPVFVLMGWFIPCIMYRQTSEHSVVERLRDIQ